MDKQTLSNYGWLVIVTLILAIMLAFATPFGTYVGDGVVSVANGIVGTSNNATNEDNISQSEIEWAVKTDRGIDYNTFKYYNTLEDAINAVNNNSYITASSKSKGNSVVVGISKDGNTPVIRLVKNIELKQPININVDVILDFCGKDIEISQTGRFNIVQGVNFVVLNKGLDKTRGTMHISNITERDYIFNLNTNSTFFMSNIDTEVLHNTQTSIIVGAKKEGSKATIENCSFVIDENLENISSAMVVFSCDNENAELNIKNCKISGKAMLPRFVWNKGTTVIDNCEMYAELNKNSTYSAPLVINNKVGNITVTNTSFLYNQNYFCAGACNLENDGKAFIDKCDFVLNAFNSSNCDCEEHTSKNILIQTTGSVTEIVNSSSEVNYFNATASSIIVNAGANLTLKNFISENNLMSENANYSYGNDFVFLFDAGSTKTITAIDCIFNAQKFSNYNIGNYFEQNVIFNKK